MYSKNGKGTIKVLPQKVNEMKEKGWTLDKPSKSKLKKEVKDLGDGAKIS